MPAESTDLSVTLFRDITRRDLIFAPFRRSTIKVLFVVDTNIAVVKGAGFGVGRVIELLRGTVVGCNDIAVDVASRDTLSFADQGPGGDGHVRYPGFRFDAGTDAGLVVDQYHVVAIFGFKPNNSGLLDDSLIDDPNVAGVVPMSTSEVNTITTWMNAGGGIFATGDHHFLGATMGHRIPRVRSMRRWTNADGVPPIGGPARLDTNQPVSPGQLAGTDMIPNEAERDARPQPIEWVAVEHYTNGLWRTRRPHPVLCHPQHGPIDVMPDHPHEGLCVPPAEIAANPDRAAEFPNGSLPQIIAYGQVVPDPPFQHAKNDVFGHRFEMVSAYDGRPHGAGRIVVDSTWHHWMDLNLDGLATAGGTDWAKISRYFINVVTWTASAGVARERCWWEIFAAHFHGPFIEEMGERRRDFFVGGLLHDHLAAMHGPCTVREFVFGLICEVHPILCEGLVERFRLPDAPVCLSCPPIELIERVVLDGVLRSTADLAESVAASVERREPIEVHVEQIREMAMAGAADALKEFSDHAITSARRVIEMFGAQ